jgi:hypothetical protein
MGNLYSAQTFIDAIPGTGGIVSAIARKVGCEWNTVKSYLDRYPTVRAAYDAECESMLDLAESTVLKAIKYCHDQNIVHRLVPYSAPACCYVLQ